MYLHLRILICGLFILTGNGLRAQFVNPRVIEVGVDFAGSETLFWGVHGKFIQPLSQRKHHFIASAGINVCNDFKGESTAEAYLRKDMDLRIIPTLNFGYSFNFNRVQLNVEIPVGVSFAITKGVLINEKFDFEREYVNKEAFLSYGFSFSPKYSVTPQSQIGLFSFFPAISDKARSGYQFGIGWTKVIQQNK